MTDISVVRPLYGCENGYQPILSAVWPGTVKGCDRGGRVTPLDGGSCDDGEVIEPIAAK